MSEDQQAKPSPVDPAVIEFKRLEVSQSRFREVFSTIRVLVICAAIVCSVGLVCWACVQIAEKPLWEALGLAILGPTGLVAWALRYWMKRSKTALQKIKAALPPENQGNQDQEGT